MDKLFREALNDLVWFPEKGWGFCPLNGQELYNDDYFQHYVDLEGTEICRELNSARLAMVNRYTEGAVLDVGIGAGTFVLCRPGTMGYDVNPKGVTFLVKRNLYFDPYREPDRSIDAMTFWDALEHIEDPGPLLEKVGRYAFISMPIYGGLNHLLASKHFKKGEHCLYFTKIGLIGWMHGHGFRCLEHNTCEVDCGREDIGSFVFEKIPAGR